MGEREVRENRPGRRNNRGFMTIEACVIVPVLVSASFFILLILLQFFRRNAIQQAALQQIYLITLRAEEEKSSGEQIAERLSADGAFADELPGESGLKAEDEALRVKVTGELELISEDTVMVTREVRCCTGRLRRWQLYGDITER